MRIGSNNTVQIEKKDTDQYKLIARFYVYTTKDAYIDGGQIIDVINIKTVIAENELAVNMYQKAYSILKGMYTNFVDDL